MIGLEVCVRVRVQLGLGLSLGLGLGSKLGLGSGSGLLLELGIGFRTIKTDVCDVKGKLYTVQSTICTKYTLFR